MPEPIDDGRTVSVNVTADTPLAFALWDYLREGDAQLYVIRPQLEDPKLVEFLSTLANNVFQGQAAMINAVQQLELELQQLRARLDG